MAAKHHYRVAFPHGTPSVVDRYSLSTYTHAWRVIATTLMGSRTYTGFSGSKTLAEIAGLKQVKHTGLPREQCRLMIVTAPVVARGVGKVSEPLAGWRMLQHLRDGQKFQEWTSPCNGFQVVGWPDRTGFAWQAERQGKMLRSASRRRTVRMFKSPEAAAYAAMAAWRKNDGA